MSLFPGDAPMSSDERGVGGSVLSVFSVEHGLQALQ